MSKKIYIKCKTEDGEDTLIDSNDFVDILVIKIIKKIQISFKGK